MKNANRHIRPLTVLATAVVLGALLPWHSARAAIAKPQDFSYEKAACPFDKKRLDVSHLQCGFLSVPERRGMARSRRIKIAVVVEKAIHPGADSAPVIFLTGGPGGVAIRPGLVGAFHQIFPRHDVIVFDQRGNGYSRPRLCPWLLDTYRYIGASDRSATEARRMMMGADRACYDALRSEGIDVRGYNTRENAADVNDIRRALGYRRLNLFAISYGGALAQAVIHDFPGTVRSAVLHAPEPLARMSHSADDYAAAFGRAMDRVFASCRASPPCHAAYPNLAKTFEKTTVALNKQPLHVSLDPPLRGLLQYVVNGQDFVNFLQGELHRGAVADIPAIISAFASRDLQRVGKVVRDALQGKRNDSQGTLLSVVCHDGPPSHARWERLTGRWPVLESTIGRTLEITACSYWDSGRASKAEVDPGHSSVPVLLMRGAYDPIIEASDMDTVAASYPNSRQITFPNDGHNFARSSALCSIKITQEFVFDPEKHLDTSCVSRLKPLTFKLPPKH